MSAEEDVLAALLAALIAHAALADNVNGIYATPPVHATPPYVQIGETLSRDWSTKTEEGRELRLNVSIFDEPEKADRLGTLMREAELAIEDIARDLPGWRIASCVFLSGRIVRAREPWAAVLEYRVRALST